MNNFDKAQKQIVLIHNQIASIPRRKKIASIPKQILNEYPCHKLYKDAQIATSSKMRKRIIKHKCKERSDCKQINKFPYCKSKK